MRLIAIHPHLLFRYVCVLQPLEGPGWSPDSRLPRKSLFLGPSSFLQTERGTIAEWITRHPPDLQTVRRSVPVSLADAALELRADQRRPR